MIIATSPETKVERMQMPRASIFASTNDTLNTINTITTPKVERKEERASIISRPAIGINSNRLLTKTNFYIPSVSPLVEVKEEKSFLYAESKRAKLEREKEERRQRMEEDFSPEDLALATVPGYDFDPKERAFQMDELRPQPIIRYVWMIITYFCIFSIKMLHFSIKILHFSIKNIAFFHNNVI